MQLSVGGILHWKALDIEDSFDAAAMDNDQLCQVTVHQGCIWVLSTLASTGRTRLWWLP